MRSMGELFFGWVGRDGTLCIHNFPRWRVSALRDETITVAKESKLTTVPLTKRNQKSVALKISFLVILLRKANCNSVVSLIDPN